MTGAVKEIFVVSKNTYNKLTGIDKMSDRILVRKDLPDDQIYMYKFPYLYRIL